MCRRLAWRIHGNTEHRRLHGKLQHTLHGRSTLERNLMAARDRNDRTMRKRHDSSWTLHSLANSNSSQHDGPSIVQLGESNPNVAGGNTHVDTREQLSPSKSRPDSGTRLFDSFIVSPRRVQGFLLTRRKYQSSCPLLLGLATGATCPYPRGSGKV